MVMKIRTEVKVNDHKSPKARCKSVLMRLLATGSVNCWCVDSESAGPAKLTYSNQFFCSTNLAKSDQGGSPPKSVLQSPSAVRLPVFYDGKFSFADACQKLLCSSDLLIAITETL